MTTYTKIQNHGLHMDCSNLQFFLNCRLQVRMLFGVSTWVSIIWKAMKSFETYLGINVKCVTLQYFCCAVADGIILQNIKTTFCLNSFYNYLIFIKLTDIFVFQTPIHKMLLIHKKMTITNPPSHFFHLIGLHPSHDFGEEKNLHSKLQSD